MFTKYNGINLPKNYSGTKFRQPPEDTTMKTHRPQDEKFKMQGIIKTSVSPSFQSIIDNASVKNNTDYSPIEEQSDVNFYKSESLPYGNDEELSSNDNVNSLLMPDDCLVEENTSKEVCSICNDSDKHNNTDSLKKEFFPINLLKENGFSRLIEGISKDDLLLIALIALFAQEHTAGSQDAIIILALLLLYH